MSSDCLKPATAAASTIARSTGPRNFEGGVAIPPTDLAAPDSRITAWSTIAADRREWSAGVGVGSIESLHQ